MTNLSDISADTYKDARYGPDLQLEGEDSDDGLDQGDEGDIALLGFQQRIPAHIRIQARSLKGWSLVKCIVIEVSSARYTSRAMPQYNLKFRAHQLFC